MSIKPLRSFVKKILYLSLFEDSESSLVVSSSNESAEDSLSESSSQPAKNKKTDKAKNLNLIKPQQLKIYLGIHQYTLK